MRRKGVDLFISDEASERMAIGFVILNPECCGSLIVDCFSHGRNGFYGWMFQLVQQSAKWSAADRASFFLKQRDVAKEAFRVDQFAYTIGMLTYASDGVSQEKFLELAAWLHELRLVRLRLWGRYKALADAANQAKRQMSERILSGKTSFSFAEIHGGEPTEIDILADFIEID